MHRLVLQDREHRLAAIQQRIAGALELGAFERIEHLPVGLRPERADGVPRRPQADTLPCRR